ncbi:DNA repair protein RecO [Lampropedia puyangensis]|uniref:DNA repair protein RecO n=2 Tax=Lampropedia puyangensis TaxID=1330072 RepID=A0A4S8FDV4_9BURK|nr:DNA repair protein RecO [Lampropedia puyangensis]THU04072.1 DNA repair protein RecO [Lampropedia puyangensis]
MHKQTAIQGQSARKTKRASQHQAYVLHQYPYSESSLILELLTREKGRIVAIAKGAKKPTSNFRSLLLPLQLLRLEYTYTESELGEIGSIRGAERAGGPATPKDEALLAGMYLNELLMRMLVRGEPHAAIFDSYHTTLHVLSHAPGAALEAVLRSFELILLRQLGMLPDLSRQTLGHDNVAPDQRYALIPEIGLHHVRDGRRSLLGQQWMDIQHALQSEQPLPECMRALGMNAVDLKPQLRAAFAHYLGGELQTQRLMRGLRSL